MDVHVHVHVHEHGPWRHCARHGKHAGDAQPERLRYRIWHMTRTRAALAYLCVGAVACASSACGMPAAPAVRPAPVHATRLAQPIAAELPPDWRVRCEDLASCPEAVGMLVVDRSRVEEPGRCTVTLIRGDRALTASHCLALEDRRAGAACARTWVVFPATASSPGESIACGRVIEATQVASDSALQQERAVLQLVRASSRKPFTIEPQPPQPGSIVTVASITPHPIFGTSHALSTRLCRVIDSTPAERVLGAAAGDVGWLMNCPIARGNSGSPVIDYAGNVRAIVHGGTNLSAGMGVTSLLAN
jgi:V8-like Glu-specific endopeptidase